MDVSSCLSMTSDILVNPLRDNDNVTTLKTFENIIRTSIGHHGKLKIVQNAAGGHVTVTSSSLRLLNIVSIQNRFLKLIVSSSKTHLNCFNNCGLCCSFLSLKLINSSLSGTCSLSTKGKLFEIFGKIFVDFLSVESNPCVIKMDLTSLDHILSITQAIILSKPGCILRKQDVQHLSFLLMKAHVNCIPTSASEVFHELNFITLEGSSCDKSSLFGGLLIRAPALLVKNLTLKNETNLKVVLFRTSLSGDAEFPVDNVEVADNVSLWESVLNVMKDVVGKIIEAKVHLFACQKVIHPTLKKQLEDANVLVLDRLGHEVSNNLEYLIGASNSSLYEEPVFGYINSINEVTIGKNDFLELSSTSKPFWTMLICNFNEQALEETKIVCQQARDTLYRLMTNPKMCFGAGCTEIHTSKLVKLKVVSSLEDIQQDVQCTTSQILEALQDFSSSITDLAIAIHQDSYLNFVTETIYGHLWKLNSEKFPAENDRCLCGRFSAASINDSYWTFFTKSDCTVVDRTTFLPVENEGKIDKSVILDELQSKISAYSLAFETASLLLRTSVCIQC